MDKKPCVAWLSFDLLHELFFRVQPQPHEITIFIAPPGFLKQEKESGKMVVLMLKNFVWCYYASFPLKDILKILNPAFMLEIFVNEKIGLVVFALQMRKVSSSNSFSKMSYLKTSDTLTPSFICIDYPHAWSTDKAR